MFVVRFAKSSRSPLAARLLPLTALATFACAPTAPPASPSTSPAAHASVTAPAATANKRAARAVVLLGDDALRHARWTHAGELVAHSSKLVWRFSAQSFAGNVVRFDEEIRDVSAARSADVLAVVLGTKKVVIQDARGRRVIEVEKMQGNTNPWLSPDGTRVAVAANGHTTLYDATTGAVIGPIGESSAAFDDASAFIATNEGVFAASDGKEVARFQALGAGSEIIGSRVVAFEKDDIVVVDAPKKAVMRFPTPCKSSEMNVDYVDVVGKRAVRSCPEGVYVVNVDKIARTVVKVPPRAMSMHDLSFVADSNNLVIRYMDDTATSTQLLVDVDKRTTRPLRADENVKLRDPAGGLVTPLLSGEGCELAGVALTPFSCNGVGSFDKKSYAVEARGEISVYDATNGKRRMLLGHLSEPARMVARSVALLPRARGLDVVATSMTAQGHTSLPVRRLGPSAPELAPRTVAAPGKTCSRGKRPIYRHIGERDVLYDAFSARACVCTDGNCVDVVRSGLSRFFDLSGETTLGESFDMKRKTARPRLRIASLDGSREVFGPEDLGRCYGAAFADEGQRVLAVCRANDDGPVELMELTSNDLTVSSRVPLDVTPEISVSLVAGRNDVLLSRTDFDGRIRGTVIARKSGKPLARIDGDDDFVVTSYPDGTLEIAGEPPAGSIACLVGDEIKPFSACRADVEVKARFTFE